jgi:hypothetical protein
LKGSVELVAAVPEAWKAVEAEARLLGIFS